MPKKKAATQPQASTDFPFGASAPAVATEPAASTAVESAFEPAVTQQPEAERTQDQGRHSRARLWTRDLRLRYTRATSDDGRYVEFRFAERPADEVLQPLRDEPEAKWSSKAKAWQIKNDLQGREAADRLDMQLRDLGQQRSAGPSR